MMNSSNTSAAMSKPTTFFQGFVILFCGVDEVIRKKAADFVVRNGGKCVDKFCTGVTCGIVGKVGSIGFKELVVAKVPLLTLKWLQDCSTSRSLAQMEGSMYKVGYATGLNVVCTQLTLEERTRVQQLVEKGGGTYSDRFVGMVCTHLIAKTPEGDKYMGAKKCGTVRIVTCSWVEECAKRKVWVPELEFSVDYIARQALREAQVAKAKLLLPFLPPPQSTTSMNGSGVFASQESALPLVAQLERCLLREIPVSALPSCHGNSSSSSGYSRQGREVEVFKGELFWIHGYSAEMTDYLTCCVLAGGGLRSMVLCDAVTIALLGDRALPSDWVLVRRHPCGVTQANAVWIIEQFHTLPGLLALFREKEPFAAFLQELQKREGAVTATVVPNVGAYSGCSGSSGDSDKDNDNDNGEGNYAGHANQEDVSAVGEVVRSMEELCTAYDRYRGRQRQVLATKSTAAGDAMNSNGGEAVTGQIATDSKAVVTELPEPTAQSTAGLGENEEELPYPPKRHRREK